MAEGENGADGDRDPCPPELQRCVLPTKRFSDIANMDAVAGSWWGLRQRGVGGGERAKASPVLCVCAGSRSGDMVKFECEG